MIDDLPNGPFRVILADPPWTFKTFSDKGRDRCPDARHYKVMSLGDIKAMPVKDIAAPSSFLFLWVTWPMLMRGAEVMESWGFKYVTCGFLWAKENKNADGFHMGTGYYSRANTEPCLIGRRGKGRVNRLNADVRQLIVEPVGDHSRKPRRVHDDIERLLEGPYCELFAREERANWSVWGNETTKYNEAAE